VKRWKTHIKYFHFQLFPLTLFMHLVSRHKELAQQKCYAVRIFSFFFHFHCISAFISPFTLYLLVILAFLPFPLSLFLWVSLPLTFLFTFLLSLFLCTFIPSFPLSWNRYNLCCCSGKGISAKLHILCSEVQKKNGEAHVTAINWTLEVRLLHMLLVLLLGCSPYMFHYIGRKLIFLPRHCGGRSYFLHLFLFHLAQRGTR